MQSWASVSLSTSADDPLLPVRLTGTLESKMEVAGAWNSFVDLHDRINKHQPVVEIGHDSAISAVNIHSPWLVQLLNLIKEF